MTEEERRQIESEALEAMLSGNQEPSPNRRLVKQQRASLQKAGLDVPLYAAGIGLDWGTGAAPLRMGVHKATGAELPEGSPWEVPGFEHSLEAVGMEPSLKRKALGMGLDIVGDPGFVVGGAAKAGIKFFKNANLLEKLAGITPRSLMNKARTASSERRASRLMEPIVRDKPARVGEVVDEPVPIRTPEEGMTVEGDFTRQSTPESIEGNQISGLPQPTQVGEGQLPLFPPAKGGALVSDPVVGKFFRPEASDFSREVGEGADSLTWLDYQKKTTPSQAIDATLGIPSRMVKRAASNYYEQSIPELSDRSFLYGTQKSINDVLAKHGVKGTGRTFLDNYTKTFKTIGQELGFARAKAGEEAKAVYASFNEAQREAVKKAHRERFRQMVRAISTEGVRNRLAGLMPTNQKKAQELIIESFRDIFEKLERKGYFDPNDIDQIRRQIGDRISSSRGVSDESNRVFASLKDEVYAAIRKLENDVVEEWTSPDFAKAYQDISHDYAAMASAMRPGNNSTTRNLLAKERPNMFLGPQGKLGSSASFLPVGALAGAAMSESVTQGDPLLKFGMGATAGTLGLLNLLSASPRMRRAIGTGMYRAADNPWGGAFIDSLARDQMVRIMGDDARKGVGRKKRQNTTQEPTGSSDWE